MHNVLFSVVYIKRGGGAKALNLSIRTYTYMHLSWDVCREITTSTQGNGSDQLLYRGLYVSAKELWRAEAITDSQACRNSTTLVLTLDASERLYQSISLFTYCYLHVVNNILYITLTTS